MTKSVRLAQARTCLRGVNVGRMRPCLNRELRGVFLTFLCPARHDLREPLCDNGDYHVVP
jgi:hypothetical protein